MVTSKPLFKGRSEQDQLRKIFKIRGIPTEANGLSLKDLPEWKKNETNFEKWEEEDLKKYVPKLNDEGQDLLKVKYH